MSPPISPPDIPPPPPRRRYPTARELAADGFAPLLLGALERHQRRFGTAAEACAALRCIAVNDPICRDIEAAGGVARITAVLAALLADLAAGEQQRRPGGAAASGVPMGVSSGSGGAGDALPAPAAASPEEALPAAPPAEAVAGSGDAAGDDDEAAARRLRMVRAGFGVLRSLSNSDTVKVAMCAGDARPLAVMLQALEVRPPSPWAPQLPRHRTRLLPPLPRRCCAQRPVSSSTRWAASRA